MNDEIIAATQIDCEQRGVRFRRDLAQNEVVVYGHIRKRCAIGGDGTTSCRQVMRDMYPDFDESLGFYRRRRYSVVRWLRLLERQGLIRCAAHRTSSGKFLGLRIELCEVPEEIAMIVARGCSSVG